MQNSRLYATVGAVVLGTVGIFATKSDKKFAYITSGKFRAYTSSAFSGLPNNTFTDTKTGNSVTVFLKTIGNGILSTLITSVNNTKTVYLKKL